MEFYFSKIYHQINSKIWLHSLISWALLHKSAITPADSPLFSSSKINQRIVGFPFFETWPAQADYPLVFSPAVPNLAWWECAVMLVVLQYSHKYRNAVIFFVDLPVVSAQAELLTALLCIFSKESTLRLSVGSQRVSAYSIIGLQRLV